MKSNPFRSKSRVLALVVVALVLAIVPTAVVQAAPVLDGNMSDILGLAQSVIAQGGCAAEKVDLDRDVRTFDPEVIPCVPVIDNYFPYELDMVHNAFVYDVATGTLYLALRSAGNIGDADGNGDPNVSCAQSNIGEAIGIGSGERFRWRLRGLTGIAGDVVVTIEYNQITITGAPGASAQYAFDAQGRNDLEVAIHGVTIGQMLDVFVMAGSLTDMFTEDAAQLVWTAPHGEPLAADPGIVRPIIRSTRGTGSSAESGTGISSSAGAPVSSLTFGSLKSRYRR